jgi:hypothetical protein
MGLPPPNYNKESILPEPVAKKTILPIQGGGARTPLERGSRTPLKSGARIQKGGAPPINEKELLVQCHQKYLQLHYVKNGELAEPIGKDVRYIDMDDVNFEGIEKKSIMYSWFIGQECFDEYVITVLNDTAEYMKEGGTVVFVDYTPKMMSLDKLKGFIVTKEKEIPLKDKWDISIVKASDFPFLLAYNTGDEDRIPTYLMLFKLLGGSAPLPPQGQGQAQVPQAVKPAPKESTIKLAVGIRVRNPEEAKDNIRELSFTPGEKVLFRRLGFDKPFIRKYIMMPEASKQVSDASKDAFFNFWKMYVLMDGTSQFSLMTKSESQKVQQYMRDILDAYHKYLTESALQLLFHTSGKPYEPVLEDVVQDSFVFTKTVNAKGTNYKKISTAAKTLIESVAATKEFDFKTHRISIAKANTLPVAKAAYDNLKKDIAALLIHANKAIVAAKEASLDGGKQELAAVEGFKFTSGDDVEDYIKAAIDLISLTNKLVKKLDDLEKAAREFAIVVELEGDNNDETYVSSENGSNDTNNSTNSGNSENSNVSDNSNAETNFDINSNADSLASVRAPANPLTQEERELKQMNTELKNLLTAVDKIVSTQGEDNKKISSIIALLSTALPDDDLGKKLRKYLGNPPKRDAIHVEITSKIAPSTFFNIYLIEKGKSGDKYTKRLKWILDKLILLDLRRLNKNVKDELINLFRRKVLLYDITDNAARILRFMDKDTKP